MGESGEGGGEGGGGEGGGTGEGGGGEGRGGGDGGGEGRGGEGGGEGGIAGGATTTIAPNFRRYARNALCWRQQLNASQKKECQRLNTCRPAQCQKRASNLKVPRKPMAVAALTEGSLSSMVAGKPARPQPQSPFRDDCLRGLVVLVTGGGSGIGLGISEAFAAHGARLTLFGRRAAVLEESCRALRERWPSCVASACRGDVREPDSCAAAVAACVREHGRLDVLVNCAAGNFMCAAEELTPTAFRTVVDIDLQGTYNMCSAALGALSGPRGRPATAGSPLVINISATLHYKALPFQAHACAAKAGIDALTRTLGLEYGCEHGVRVVGIASCSDTAAQRPSALARGSLQPRPRLASVGLGWPRPASVFRLAGRTDLWFHHHP